MKLFLKCFQLDKSKADDKKLEDESSQRHDAYVFMHEVAKANWKMQAGCGTSRETQIKQI